MAVSQDPDNAPGELASFVRTLRRVRLTVPAVAAFFLLMGFAGDLSPLQALIGFGVISGAALIDAGAEREDGAAARSREDARSYPRDGVIEAVIAGLPDPVIVLERDSIVRAFNKKALEIAPALTRGRPLSFALRNPGVLEAVRRAAEAGVGLRV